uniref:Uncharacterized protein n=1 Tax=Knipowitschia caucasica TaxID=637954 RepID=A0AAV2L5T3_KNICA
MQSSTNVRAPVSPDDSAPDSPSILLRNVSPVPPSPRKSVRLDSRDPGSVRAFLAARGVPLSEEKTTGPATALEFLGIRLDTRAMEASLPLDKLERIRAISRKMRSQTFRNAHLLFSWHPKMFLEEEPSRLFLKAAL